MNKYLIICLFFSLLTWGGSVLAQGSGQVAFNQAANYFIEGQVSQALQTINSGLQKNPNDAKLKALKKKIEEQKKKQEKQEKEEKEEKEDKEGEKSEEEKEKEGEEKKEEKGEEKEEEEKEGKEGEEPEEEKPKEGEETDDEKEKSMKETEKRLEEMNISPEKARMILEAMKSNEVQYLQQKKRNKSKRSDSGKPDW